MFDDVALGRRRPVALDDDGALGLLGLERTVEARSPAAHRSRPST